MIKAVYKVEWTESERGWGQRPDGHSFHASKEEANEFIKAYWDKQPKGPAPDCYVKPGTPFLTEVSEVIYDLVNKKRNIRY